MKFHKVEMVGKFILQKVDNLPTFDATRDEGRIVFNLNDNKVYQGSNTKWVLINNGVIPAGDITTDTPENGKIVFNTNNKLYYGNGTDWHVIGGGETPEGDITTDTPEIGKVIYDNGKLYYGNGTQWIEIGLSFIDWSDINNKPTSFTPSSHSNSAHSVDYTPETRTLTAGSGLSGGGNLTANRTFNVLYGTAAGTACQGNDSRLSDARTPLSHDNTKHSVNYTPETRSIIAGTGLSGGGTLAANRTINVDYGTAAGTAAQGNDSRLSDDRTPLSHDNTKHSVNYTPETRSIIAGTGLSGGGALTANRTLSVDYGTAAGTACQGNDSRLDSDRTRKITLSNAEASGGANGDIWMKFI